MEKERGRRKMTERARKWREWALIMLLDSDSMPQRFRLVPPAIAAQFPQPTPRRRKGIPSGLQFAN